MRFTRETVAVALTFGALVAGAGATPGCISGDDNAAPTPDGGSPQSQGDSSTPTPTPDATIPVDGAGPVVDGGTPPQGEASTPDAGPLPALVRFAWFVGGVSSQNPQFAPQGTGQDAGVLLPAYDVCVAVHGTGAWMGPLLAQSSFAAGLQPFDVTKYFEVPPGQYDARIVPAGSTTCNLPDAGAPSVPDAGDAGEGGADDAAAIDAGSSPSTDFTSLPAIAAGSALTAVLVDPLDPAATVADLFTFTDDTTTASGKAKLRFVNVSENDTATANDAGADAGDAGVTLSGADFGIGGGALLDTLFTNVTSQEHLDPGATNGYRDVDPLSGVDSTLLPQTGQQDYESPLATDAITLPAGGIFTAFYATESGGEATRNPVLVWCYDGVASSANPLLSQCGHIDVSSDSVRSYTRFGDFSADGDGRDVCVKYHSYGAYVGPLLKNNDTEDGGTGIPAQYISSYFNLHGGLVFDARFVNAGAADCSAPVTGDTTFLAYSEPNGGGYTSVLLTGYATVPADAGTIPPYDAGPPATDDAGETIDAGPQPTSDGLTTLATSVVVIEDESWAADDEPAIRLVHVAADHPAPIAMSVTGGTVVVGDDDDDDDDDAPGIQRRFRPLAGNQWELDNVPYGGFSTRPGPTDPFGYETMGSGALDITFGTNDWTYNTGGDQTTMFAYDGPTGVALLACDDYDEDMAEDGSPLYQDCCVVGSANCSAEAEVLVTSVVRTLAHKHSRRLIQTLHKRY